MWRSLWQTPAAFTLISTCVPDGCGVASSNSCSGALKSATLKLFIGVLPAYFLSSPPCHDRRGETNPGAVLQRLRARWIPVRVKKPRQHENLEPRSDHIGTGL